MTAQVYHDAPPPDFLPTLEAAGCYVESGGQLLYLKRAPGDRYCPHTWGIPAGKLEPGEDSRAAVIRETFEEAGILIDGPDLDYLGKLYIVDAIHYIFHIYRKPLLRRPAITLKRDEHTESLWLTPSEALRLPRIAGGAEALHYYTQRKPHAHR